MSLRLDAKLYREIRVAAAQADQPMSEWIRSTLASAIKPPKDREAKRAEAERLVAAAAPLQASPPAPVTPKPIEFPPLAAPPPPTNPPAEAARKPCPDRVYSWHGRPGSYECPTCGTLCEGPPR